jgi:serine/threonine protein kinase
MNASQKNSHAVNTIHDVEAESTGDARRLSAILETYLAQLEQGQRPDRNALLRDYPELADQLRECLDGLDLIHGAASDLCGAAGGEEQSLPQALGDFRILREIGRGGMGVVYEAEQLSIGRRVALKVLPFAAMLDRQQLNRFKNEARAAGTLNHPNIVAVHSVGCDRGVHYYAMELVEGQSLAHLVEHLKASSELPSRRDPARGDQRDNSPPLHGERRIDTAPVAALSTLPDFSSKEYFRTIARLGIQAAEALDHAHQNGILHRDIKPANLLVDDTGKLWITDFGLARIEIDAGMTMTGDLLGTLRYMSPEQALAKSVVVDHRSDIYSLGITLYELLTLQPAFSGDDRQELLRKIAFEDPRPPRQINARIPHDLETIVFKATAKEPPERYTSMTVIADDLRCYLESRPIHAKRKSTVDRI